MDWEYPDSWREEWDCWHVYKVSWNQRLLKTDSPWVLSVTTLHLGKEYKAVCYYHLCRSALRPWGWIYSDSVWLSFSKAPGQQKQSGAHFCLTNTQPCVYYNIKADLHVWEKMTVTHTYLYVYLLSRIFAWHYTEMKKRTQSQNSTFHPLQLVCWDKFVHFPC